MAERTRTPLDEYIAALDRTASAARELADLLRGAKTEDALLREQVLAQWSSLTERMKADAEVVRRGSEIYQRWARVRFQERVETSAYKLPSYQR